MWADIAGRTNVSVLCARVVKIISQLKMWGGAGHPVACFLRFPKLKLKLVSTKQTNCHAVQQLMCDVMTYRHPVKYCSKKVHTEAIFLCQYSSRTFFGSHSTLSMLLLHPGETICVHFFLLCLSAPFVMHFWGLDWLVWGCIKITNLGCRGTRSCLQVGLVGLVSPEVEVQSEPDWIHCGFTSITFKDCLCYIMVSCAKANQKLNWLYTLDPLRLLLWHKSA